MKTSLSILFALILLPLQAQVSISKSDIAFRVGDVHAYQTSDHIELVTNINPETSGANVRWDFSSPDVTFLDVKSLEYVDPSSTVYTDSVEGANLAIKSLGEVNGVYQFVNITDEGLEHLYSAFYQDGSSNMSTFTPPLLAMKYPMTYGQAFQQEYAVEMLHLGKLFMLDSSTTSVEVDAWGTVSTPAGTFTDVLRMKRTTIAAGYMYHEGNWMFTSDLSTTDYSWFKAGIHTALVNISKFEDEDGYSMVYLTNPEITGMEAYPTEADQADDLFRIYPNPVTDVLTLECSSGNIESYILFDTSGRIVKQEKNCASHAVVLPTSDISSGSYILEISSGIEKSRKKVIIK